jgi:EAL domain-containing protein (putative c-di-GMP-specific phosphodiesterase class I)
MTQETGFQVRPKGWPHLHRGLTGPVRRLLGVAARAMNFSDATVWVVDGPRCQVLASTHAGIELDSRSMRLAEVTAHRGRPLVDEDTVAQGAPRPAGADATGTQAYVGLPLLGPHENVVGVFGLTSTRRRTIEGDQIALAAEFGRVIVDELDLLDRAAAAEAMTDGVSALAQAIDDGQIVPWYQPIIDLATGEILGVEALARWHHPTGEVEDPAIFIPLAERSDLIIDLDLAVMRHALRDLREWQQTFPAFRISLNVSGRNLHRDGWVDVVRQIARDAGVSPASVDLELTESARPTEHEAGRRMIEAIRALGFRVWFDDFGSGWSALQDLVLFPVDGVKMDRSFAAELGTRADTVIRAVTTAAHELGLKVTIEGIESNEQAVLARDLGCHYGQGFLWSAPVPARDLAQLLASSGQPP